MADPLISVLIGGLVWSAPGGWSRIAPTCCSSDAKTHSRCRTCTSASRPCRESNRFRPTSVDRDERGGRHERTSVVKNPTDNQPVLEAVQDRMRALGIAHVTVQVEREPTCD